MIVFSMFFQKPNKFRTNLLPLVFTLPPALLVYAAATAQVRVKTTKRTNVKSAAKPAAAATSPAADAKFQKEVLPFIQKYCVGCHGPGKPQAGISLLGYKDAASVLKGRDVWEKVSKSISAGYMPPQGTPQPMQNERDAATGWIDSFISQADCKLEDPGRVTMRRLNREEYNNTIRDLFGVAIRPADEFPSDDVGYGFDNIGDVLSISPLLMEKYLKAAEKVAQAVIVTPENAVKTVRINADKFTGDGNLDNALGRLLATNGEMSVAHEFPAEGEYLVKVHAFAHQAGGEPARMAIKLDGQELKQVDVKAVEEKPAEYQVKVKAAKGQRRIATAFLNDYYNAEDPNPKNRDRNLGVNYIEIVGPMSGSGPLPTFHRRLIPAGVTKANREQAVRKTLMEFASRAYRRPATKADVDRLMRAVKLAEQEGESFESGVQLAVQSVLVSPHFLFRIEVDPEPNNPKAKRNINDYELASRLSYFLWSSMPDAALFKLAATKQLSKPAVLKTQVSRMLKDPKAGALADNFASQWLTLRNLNNATPDPARFPNFNKELRDAMKRETLLYFETVVKEDRSVLDFIDGKFTFVNELLAKHYGMEGVSGKEFKRVALDGKQRGGILSHASILTVTSNPTRTSPVKRGKWVLEQMLGTPPPPAPPNVPELADDKKGPLVGTLRQRMEQHRKDPLCASCHTRMDAIGFGLENYDAVGAWRVKDGESDIDASGTLPGGKSFKGPSELRGILKSQKNLFVRNLAEKMLTYALGRGLESTDKCEIDAIAAAMAQNNYKFSSLITAVVQSDPFRMRRGDGGNR